MSNVFNQNISNLGSAGVEKATQQRNKYNQELTKREMISQTEESLGGIKLFTSGRELGSKILKDSKIKDYAKQQIDKALGKAKTAKPTKPTKPTEPAEPTEEADLPEIPLPEIRTARSVTNDISDARLNRIGRIAQNKKQSKIDRGMSEEDAEADRLNYIQGRVDGMTAKENLNNNLQTSNDAINEEATSQFQADTEARANLKAAGKDKQQAKGKGKGDEEEVGGEEAAGEEGAEITGTEAAASVLDAMPGLDLLGAALGIGGLAAGFGKKPPKQISAPVSQSSYSSQIGLS